LGIIGINDSPTCSISGKKGVFLEEILSLLEKHKIGLNYCEVPSDYNDDTDYESMILRLKKQLAID
jgi:hypothetical protein